MKEIRQKRKTAMSRQIFHWCSFCSLLDIYSMCIKDFYYFISLASGIYTTGWVIGFRQRTCPCIRRRNVQYIILSSAWHRRIHCKLFQQHFKSVDQQQQQGYDNNRVFLIGHIWSKKPRSSLSPRHFYLLLPILLGDSDQVSYNT